MKPRAGSRSGPPRRDGLSGYDDENENRVFGPAGLPGGVETFQPNGADATLFMKVVSAAGEPPRGALAPAFAQGAAF
jgi:hypothetical protein